MHTGIAAVGHVVNTTTGGTLLTPSSPQELSPPLVDDFLYLCDDAYNREQMLAMERDVLRVVDYDINAPVTYRFIRRLARVKGGRGRRESEGEIG